MLEELKTSFDTHASKNAFCIEDQFYTYEWVLKKAIGIIDEINIRGGSNSGRIGIITTNSISTYASILACWFTGNAYVPLGPLIPKQRNTFIIHQAEIDLILGPTNGLEIIDIPENGVEFIDTTSLYSDAGDLKNWQRLEDSSLVYILFTSGSTGIPKGVPITYQNLRAFLNSHEHLGFEISSNDRVLQMFDLTFDVSVASYLVPLMKGACVYTVSSEGVKYMNVIRTLRNNRITFASIVPSVISYLKPYLSQIVLPDLRYCIFTAEASAVAQIKQWAACMPNGKIINLYGPTEATIWCVGYTVNSATPKSYNGVLAIGRPFSNVKAFIADENGKEVPDGIKGELCIVSTQLTIGYLNNETKNQQSFFKWKNERAYKTGDLCYRDEDGDILYCGRIDHQVKIQGFRIELSEIEVAAREFTDVNCIAIVRKNNVEVDEIFLFLEKYQGDTNELKQQLESKLPYYMIPKIKVIEEFPVNSSSKIDRMALTKMASVNEG